MPQFQISHITPFSSCQSNQGVYLWIIHATKIPPHIGMSVDGNYYSLKISGTDDLFCEKVIQLILKKKIPTILVKLRENEPMIKRFLTVRNTYDRIIPGKTTCLTPIIETVLAHSNSMLLPELLETLTTNKQIETFFGLNLPEDFDGMIAYEAHQVEQRLNELKDAKRTTYFS